MEQSRAECRVERQLGIAFHGMDTIGTSDVAVGREKKATAKGNWATVGQSDLEEEEEEDERREEKVVGSFGNAMLATGGEKEGGVSFRKGA
ncbi:hypothetical protein OPV22_030722 [Ensete ventricosum]|uniref:Uncharacterized protein n=1 Tax=Ensete ventricosum TaxID=4639 RepID=A0AAV8NYU2_ENSVE|nr:hypothetical protein OPV22_030722 [Ensete ventricosum]